jgi:hypothetical protein
MQLSLSFDIGNRAIGIGPQVFDSFNRNDVESLWRVSDRTISRNTLAIDKIAGSASGVLGVCFGNCCFCHCCPHWIFHSTKANFKFINKKAALQAAYSFR